MMKKNEVSKKDPNITKFLLKDTKSLRNEINFTKLKYMVHPLTFSYDLKKHPNQNCVPIIDMPQINDESELKKKFLELVSE